jgi:hypothetical protein
LSASVFEGQVVHGVILSSTVNLWPRARGTPFRPQGNRTI